jgi:hypothetical protein
MEVPTDWQPPPYVEIPAYVELSARREIEVAWRREAAAQARLEEARGRARRWEFVLAMRERGVALRAIGQDLEISAERVRQLEIRGRKEREAWGQAEIGLGVRRAPILQCGQGVRDGPGPP